MLLKPGAPYHPNSVSKLHHRSHSRPRAAPDQAQMPAMLAREDLEDDIGFAMSPSAQHNALVGKLQSFGVSLPCTCAAPKAVPTRVSDRQRTVQSGGNSNPICKNRSGSLPQFSRTLTNKNR